MIFISCLSRGVRGVKGVSGIRESRAEKTARLFAFSHWLLVRLKNLGSLANAILPNLIKFPTLRRVSFFVLTHKKRPPQKRNTAESSQSRINNKLLAYHQLYHLLPITIY